MSTVNVKTRIFIFLEDVDEIDKKRGQRQKIIAVPETQIKEIRTQLGSHACFCVVETTSDTYVVTCSFDELIKQYNSVTDDVVNMTGIRGFLL
jgi:hypothetical protein